MKSNMLIAIALLSLAGVAVPARAQEASVAVTVPFEFVVGGKVLPAGKYTVSKTTFRAQSSLLISGREQGAYVLPADFDNAKVGSASLSFATIAGQHVLSQIQTVDGTYSIDNRQEEKRLTRLAQSNPRSNGMPASSGQ